MKRLPTENEWLAWSSQDPTDTLREFAKSKIAGLKERWADGIFTYPADTPTLMKNAEALGEIKAWSVIAGLSYEDIVTELGDKYES